MKRFLHFICTSQAFKNSFWSGFEVLVLPVLMLLITPYFLQKLGAETYGQWVLINSIIASLGILNLGVGDATIRFISKYKTADASRATRIANTTYSLYLFISIAALCIGYLYLTLEKHFPLFLTGNSFFFLDVLKLALVLFGIRLIEQIIFSIYKGFERFDLFSKTSIASKIILVTTNIVVVYWGHSLYMILVFSVLSSLTFLIVEFFLLKKFLFDFSVVPKLDKEIFSEIMTFGIWSWIQSIIGILSYQLDKFIVAYFAGMTVLAYYSIGFTIASQMFNVFVASSNWIFPKISAKNMERRNLALVYHKLQFTLVLATSIIISVFFFTKDPFLYFWLGGDIYSKAVPYINSYCIYILIATLTIIPSYFMLGTSNMKLMLTNTVTSIILSTVFMYLMFQFFGSMGLVYGRIVSVLVTIPVFQVLFYKLVLEGTYKYIIFETSIPVIFSVLLFTQNKPVAIIGIIISAFIFIYFVNKNVSRAGIFRH